jgi:dihydropteroate synthase
MNPIAPIIYKLNQRVFDFSSQTYLMGILNVTPDSFSDGGKFVSVDGAVDFALRMIDEGADIIDVGGESSRPGSLPVSVDEEIQRVLPIIEKLAKRTDIPISIDTYKSEVAKISLDAGAIIVNDISGLHFDSMMASVVSENNASLVIMHIKGTPRTMQVNPDYKNLIEDIKHYLFIGISRAVEARIKQIFVDPGIGFGKTVQQNLEIIKNLQEFSSFGYPVLVGPSRKSFIGKILDLDVDDRFEGTAASVAACVMNGANIVRVHDVKAMKRIVRMIDAINKN